jgi:hypothetical protein
VEDETRFVMGAMTLRQSANICRATIARTPPAVNGTRGSFFENSPSTTIAAGLTPVWDQEFRNNPTRPFRLEFKGTCCLLVTASNRCQFLVDYITNIVLKKEAA